MTATPLMIAILSAVLFYFLGQKAPLLAFIMLVFAWIWVVIWLAYRLNYLPGKIMDFLSRYTNKDELRQLLHEAETEIKAIDANEMKAAVKQQVIGQDRIINELAHGIARRMSITRRGKPIYSCLVSGPTGTGKTELAKAITKFMFGDEKHMFRIDVGNMDSHGLSTLVGSPRGYAGSDEGGTLTNHVKVNPHTIILFDEIEKAGKDPTTPLYKMLLSLLDEGRITDQSSGETIDATQAIIFMTSNAASRELGELAEKMEGEELARASKDTLQGYFAPELLARIDFVTSVNKLTTEAKANICILHLLKIADAYDLKIQHIEPKLLVRALEKWRELEKYGTRELIRELERMASDGFIDAKQEHATEIRLNFDLEKDQIIVEATEWNNSTFGGASNLEDI